MRRHLLEALLAIALFALFAVVFMHPLFADLGNSTLDGDRVWLSGFFPRENPRFYVGAINRDINLFVWVYAWNWHALIHDPFSWFNANIFYPAPYALAFSEHAIGKLLLTGPLYAFTGNPIFAYQADLLACFALSGGAMFFTLRRFGLRSAAAGLASFVYAFGPARVDSLYHSYLLAGQFLPLIFLQLDRTLVYARARSAVWLMALLLFQLLCSYYIAYMTALGLAAYALVTISVGRKAMKPRGVALVILAAATALVSFAILSLPYLAAREAGAVPSYQSAVMSDALSLMSNGFWENYLIPLHFIRSSGMTLSRGSFAYLGVIPVLLAVYAGFRRRLPESTRRLRAAAFALAGVSWIFALGPELPIGEDWPGPYAAAMSLIPGFSSMRVPGRFGLMVLTGVSVLVGIGADGVLRNHRLVASRWITGLVAITLLGLVAIDYGYGTERFGTRPFVRSGNAPDIYRLLAEQEPGPLLELPATRLGRGGRNEVRNSEYMVWSTFHWNPLLNGTSGYVPPSHGIVMRLSRQLPAWEPLQLLTRLTGLRYVILHEAEIPGQALAAWGDPEGLELVATAGGDRLYRLRDAPAPDLRPALIQCAESRKDCDALRERLKGTLHPSRPRASTKTESPPRQDPRREPRD